MTKDTNTKSHAGKIIASAILGAAAGAAAVTLSDKNKREAIKKHAHTFGKNMTDKIDNAKNVFRESTKRTFNEGKKRIESASDETKKKMEDFKKKI